MKFTKSIRDIFTSKNKQNGKMGAISMYRKYGIIIILFALFILAAIISPNFVKPRNLMNVLKQITPIVIVGCAQTMLLVSGMVDLSAGMVIALCGVLAADTLVATNSVFLSFIVAIIAGMFVGFINGTLITRFRLPSFIATLATMNIVEGGIFLYSNAEATTGLEKIRWLGQGHLLGVPSMVYAMLIVVVTIQIIMKITKFGLYMFSIGGNEKASIAAGINVKKNKILTFMLAGSLIGITGVIMSARMMSGQPNVGPGYEFDGITAAIIGGTGFTGGIGGTPGTLVGSMIIGLINNILNLMNVQPEWQMVAKGLLISTAVILDLQAKKLND